MNDLRYNERNWSRKSAQELAADKFRNAAMTVFNHLCSDPVATKWKKKVRIAGATYVITVKIKDD